MNLSGTLSEQVAAFSASNLWVFSEGQDKFANPDRSPPAITATRGRRVTLPVLPSRSARYPPTDIWSSGGSCPT